MSLRIENIGGRNIILSGLGKMFYQEGIPIGTLAHFCEQKGYVVSWLHVCKELLDHGWKPTTVLSKLTEEIRDSHTEIDISEISRFVHAQRDARQQMIFNYLFGSTDEARKYFVSKLS